MNQMATNPFVMQPHANQLKIWGLARHTEALNGVTVVYRGDALIARGIQSSALISFPPYFEVLIRMRASLPIMSVGVIVLRRSLPAHNTAPLVS